MCNFSLPCPLCEKPLDETRIKFQCGHEYHATCGVKWAVYGCHSCRVCSVRISLEPPHVKQYLANTGISADPESLLAEAKKHRELGEFYNSLSIVMRWDKPPEMAREDAMKYIEQGGVGALLATCLVIILVVWQVKKPQPLEYFIPMVVMIGVADALAISIFLHAAVVLRHWKRLTKDA